MIRMMVCAAVAAGAAVAQVGMFEASTDVGSVKHKGSATYDAASNTYTVTGGGTNMWGTEDAFHFVWRKMSGDLAISGDVRFATETGNNHKKAVILVRQSLEPGSAYADAAAHLDGLTSLQGRETAGDATHEVQAPTKGGRRLRLEKRGEYFSMWYGAEGEPLRMSGASMRIPITGTFYVGIGVCSHDNAVAETAVFSNVAIEALPRLYSSLETISVASTDRRVVHVQPGKIEAPNWTPDGQNLVYNGDGKLWSIPAEGGAEPRQIDTGFATRLNNDHGISFDGKWIAISDQSQEQRRSLIYVIPASGGAPRRVTAKAPSYWHGWSPDGKTLTYCADRNGNYDVYTIPVEGGEETRLTTAEGLDDGPEYSPDGRYIYFNSVRTGNMQIWRMKPDGSGQERVTEDDLNNWFPHLSPDGKSMAFLTYEKGVDGHPANKDVMLRLMDLATGKVRILAKLFGGQGTINVPSWSPDSRRLAFVSYQLLP